MGKGIAQRSMGIPKNPEEVHRGNSILSNIQSGSSYTGQNKLMQCPGFGFHPSKEFRVNVEIAELVGGTPRIGDYTIGRISAETCPEVRQRRAEKGICSGRFGTSKGCKEYVGCQRREVNTDLGRTL